MKSNLIQYLPKNYSGRDFAVGDIHGYYDPLINAMKRLNFNPAVDRLLVVGDLVDRGPGSMRVLKFLSQPYVYSVRGNHEQMIIEYLKDGIPSRAVMEYFFKHNGMNWLLELADSELLKIYSFFCNLPVLLEVETERGLLGLVHSQVPNGLSWGEFKSDLIENARDGDYLLRVLEDRSRFKSEDQSVVDGVWRIFSGHNVEKNGIKKYGNTFSIDTGSVFSLKDKDYAHLSVVNATSKTEFILNAARSSYDDDFLVVDF